MLSSQIYCRKDISKSEHISCHHIREIIHEWVRKPHVQLPIPSGWEQLLFSTLPMITLSRTLVICMPYGNMLLIWLAVCHLTWLVELSVVPYWCHSSANLRFAQHDIYQMRLMLPQWIWSNFLCLLMHICCELGHDKYNINCVNKNKIWDWSIRYLLTNYLNCLWLETT